MSSADSAAVDTVSEPYDFVGVIDATSVPSLASTVTVVPAA